MLAHQPAVLKRHPVGLGELQVGDVFRGLRRHLPALGVTVLVETGEPEEAVLALRGDISRRAVGAEEIVDIEFVMRHQPRDHLDILECPVSERCLARDSASRACNLGKGHRGAGNRGGGQRQNRKGRIHATSASQSS